jgi:diguanylate cyclase (GGDEF)-like protein
MTVDVLLIGAATAELTAPLHELGCARPVIAPTSQAALRALHGELALVLLDFDLPDVDGARLCREVAAAAPDVPIIGYSRRTDEAAAVRAFAARVYDFVRRPFRLAELAARMTAAVAIRAERRARRELETRNRELASNACVDPLTGIANRRHFDALLRAEWRRAARDQTELALILFDLDHFHAFNDRYGHLGGDACLVRVVDTLAHGLRRASDVLSRYGGEELVAVLPDTTRRGAVALAERLRETVGALGIAHAGSPAGVVTVSAGIASARPELGAAGERELVAAADRALYRAKRGGRDRCSADGLDTEGIVVARKPWPACPVCVVDPALAPRIPAFLARVRRELPATSATELATVAHALRRTSLELGLEAFGRLGARLEAAARAGESALHIVDEIARYVDHVQVVYRKVEVDPAA